MKIDISTANELGALDARGNALGDEIAKLTAEYHAKFRAVCEANGFDPMSTVIDFVTGEVTPHEPKAVS